jgi:hypothetical protein
MDSRRKKVLSVLGVAGVILVWRAYGVVGKFWPAPAQASSNQAAETAAPSPPVTPDSAVQDDSPRMWEAQQAVASQPWGRDPFADLAGAVTGQMDLGKEARGQSPLVRDGPPAPPLLHFNGVSVSGSQWLAVVRGDIVHVGDLIDGEYKIVEITKRSITLEGKGWTFRYELGSDEATVQPVSEKP